MTPETPQQTLSMQLLDRDYAALSPVQKSVIDLMADERPSGVSPVLGQKEGAFWDRTADRVAAVGGSWGFIFGFGLVLVLWIGGNLVLTIFRAAFDPYPFIFLNLVLSTLAAIQAPIIMMSQNRQAEKDRIAAEHDYRINLRAELEIMRLHDRLDALRENDLAEMIRCQNETLSLLQQQVGTLQARMRDGDGA